MTHGEWLPLLNYSTKHSISLSTLRRRIKAASIEFKLENGKYFILDESTAPQVAVAVAPVVERPKITIASPQRQDGISKPHIHEPFHENSLTASSFVEASVLTSANRLVEEIKSAYAKILQEKEEQVAQLKEEVVDLRMLVRILEEGLPAERRAPPSQDNSSDRVMGGLNEAAVIQNLHESAAKISHQNDDEFFFSDFQNREI